MSNKKIIVIASAFVIILLILKRFFFYQTEKPLLIIEATFMQYACGEQFDDMKVLKISNPEFNFLIGKDIDPIVAETKDNLKEYFYSNRTSQFGLSYRLKGHLSKKRNGCDGESRCFYIESIEMLNGKNLKEKNNF